ncbi:DUF2690 domain-containing protein [Streptacidiphilus sp. MAP12-16]|uniref:DUF2690 domain-containing protein n=1 Tax=Streptacidiphilus sp. MAP12-16 TaxID=3156300 RepID=UPI0035160A4A
MRTGVVGLTGIQLRYSPTCRAAWARVTNGHSGDEITIKNSKGNYYAAWVPSGGGDDVHTHDERRRHHLVGLRLPSVTVAARASAPTPTEHPSADLHYRDLERADTQRVRTK